ADLWADVDDPGDLRLIWVEIKEPNYNPDTEEGVQVEMDTFKKATEELDIENSNRYLWPGVGSGSDPIDLFDIPGTYQVLYFAKDDTTGHVSPLVSSRIYKDKDGNNPPEAFNLLEPLNGDTVATVLPLMWERSTDTDDQPDPVTYTVEISEDSDFSSFAFKKEVITDEFLFIDNEAGLTDGTPYYWRVIAIDQYGAQTYSSEERSFETDNTNGIPGYLMGMVMTELGLGIGGATIEVAGEVLPTTTHNDGTYRMPLPSGTFTVTASATGYESKSEDGVEILSSNYTNQDFVIYSLNDIDEDGIDDDVDNCPDTYNPDQADSDEDGLGDECDGCPEDFNKTEPGICGCETADTDSDEDDNVDCIDNCPYTYNPDQDDLDEDGTGDACDECPEDPNKVEPGCGCGLVDIDTDLDGTPDCNDLDDDNDGMPDEWEIEYDLDPLFDDAAEDYDGDGFSNVQEYNRGTDPTDSNSHPPKFMPWLPLLLDD
ncbi:carboxypeptidase regulatory-like domain-containing protein, partial [Thermodesulfobacteriota bacterium]